MNMKQRQALLAYYGCYGGAIDGVWGSESIKAAEVFQAAVGLRVDGVCGAKTDAALIANVGKDIQIHPPDVTDTNVGDTGSGWEGSKYFSRQEFRCPCGKCGGFPVEPTEAIVLEANAIREALGRPMIIVPPDGHSGGSGVRCAAYNATFSNSVSNSRHLQGKAIDFSCPGITDATIEATLKKHQADGKLRYWYKISAGSFHADVT